LPLLDNLWTAREQLAEEEQNIAATITDLARLQENIEQINPEVDNARNTKESALVELQAAEAQMQSAQLRAAEITHQLQQLKIVEALEKTDSRG